jgi:uncharacterized surface protein with fasciclin (FAS1) repeats
MTTTRPPSLANKILFNALCVAVIVVMVLPSSNANVKPDPQSNSADRDSDIVEVSLTDTDSTTFISALNTADLLPLLQSPGPYTVFVPTDEAFSKLSKHRLQSLMQDTEALKKLLASHIIDRSVSHDHLASLQTIQTISGQTLKVDTDKDTTIENARIVRSDLTARNGIVHMIDSVIEVQ